MSTIRAGGPRAYGALRADQQILIVSNEMDAHADHMIRFLRDRGVEPVRLNTDDFPHETKLSVHLGEEAWSGVLEILTSGRVVSLADVGAVWYRRPYRYRFGADVPLHVRAFASAEIDHLLQSLWASLTCHWIGHPDRVRAAGWKLEQLQRARRMGFDTPSTLITTSGEDARAFAAEHDGQVIYKALDAVTAAHRMASVPASEQETAYAFPTRLLTSEDLDRMSGAELAPCMLQEYVDKALELRVTVVEDEVFVAEIDSQAHPDTRVDFRHYAEGVAYREGAVPEDVRRRCLELVHSYQLNYSAMDVILTPDGRHVFLENNPAGQYLFVEQRVPGLRISEAIAASLTAGAGIR